MLPYCKLIGIILFIRRGKAKEVVSFNKKAKLAFASPATSASYIFALMFCPPSMLTSVYRKEE